jgi:serine/threonine protein kinase
MDSKNKPNLIGQGTYGCVVRPSLKCTTKQNYTNKVSKLMDEIDALEEQQEMKKLKNITGIDVYTMSYPEICKPETNKDFYNIAEKCDASAVKDHVNNKEYEKLSLLLSDDGGVDLSQFVNTIFSRLTLEQQNFFFTSIIDLLNGLLFFIQNGIIHHDIKLANIVYNVKTGRAKFIDFGLMITQQEFIQQSKANKNNIAVSWSYFPPEISCANKINYETKEKCKEFHNTNQMLLHPYKNYDDFLIKLSNSIDGYCLSLALHNMFTIIQNQKGYKGDSRFIYKVKKLFADFVGKKTPHGYKRRKDYVNLKGLYNSYAKESDVIVKKKPTVSKKLHTLSNKLGMTRKMIDSVRRNCLPEKPVYNPDAKICVKKCKEHEIRDNKFHCIKKTKKQTIKKTKKQTIKKTKKQKTNKKQ